MYKLAPLFSDFNTPVGIQRGVYRLSDNAFIPMDIQNSDYAEFLKKQAEGVKVYAADETIPDEVTE